VRQQLSAYGNETRQIKCPTARHKFRTRFWGLRGLVTQQLSSSTDGGIIALQQGTSFACMFGVIWLSDATAASFEIINTADQVPCSKAQVFHACLGSYG